MSLEDEASSVAEWHGQAPEMFSVYMAQGANTWADPHTVKYQVFQICGHPRLSKGTLL